MHQEVPESKRILELNPKHPLIEGLFDIYLKNDKAPELNAYAKVLFDQALLTEGSPLPDPGCIRQIGDRSAAEEHHRQIIPVKTDIALEKNGFRRNI